MSFYREVTVDGYLETQLSGATLFASMALTPISVLVDVVRELVMNPKLTGVVAEISGEKYTFREPPDFVDEITRQNMDAFWALGNV